MIAGSVRRWLALWRPRPVDVRSALDPTTAAARLRAARRGLHVAPLSGHARLLRGSIAPDRVRLWARRLAVHNPWRPVLQGRFIAEDGGSRLIGTLGWRPVVRVFTAAWLGFVGLFLLLGMTMAATRLGRSWGGAAELFLLAVAGLATAAFSAGLVAVGSRLGRRDEEFLRAWLEQQLNRS